MIQQTRDADEFKHRIREVLRQETASSSRLTIAKRANVYTCGDRDEVVYFIESGQIKLQMLSAEGRECLLAIYGAGDIFGELCLSGFGARRETATAMEQTVIKPIPRGQFFARLGREGLLEGFVRYLASRISDQQQMIAHLVTANSEQRLGKTLLQLAITKGKKDPCRTLINLRISHEELSAMVGTTRPRVSFFMQRFHHLGLIETSSEHLLIIKEQRLADYLDEMELGKARDDEALMAVRRPPRKASLAPREHRAAGFIITLELLLVMALVVVPLLIGSWLLGRKLFTLYLNQRDFIEQPLSDAGQKLCDGKRQRAVRELDAKGQRDGDRLIVALGVDFAGCQEEHLLFQAGRARRGPRGSRGRHRFRGRRQRALEEALRRIGPKPLTKEHVAKKIGAIARPDEILFAADLPKTRSGKIMRRLLRDIAEGRALGDTTTLADPAVVAKLKAEYEEKGE